MAKKYQSHLDPTARAIRNAERTIARYRQNATDAKERALFEIGIWEKRIAKKQAALDVLKSQRGK